MKTALITGITGQDGSYLSELLLAKGYTIHGVIRRWSSFNTGRIEHLYQDPHEPEQRLLSRYGDLTDSSRLVTLIERVSVESMWRMPRADRSDDFVLATATIARQRVAFSSAGRGWSGSVTCASTSPTCGPRRRAR